MKSVVQPCIGWGFHAGCDSDAEPSSFLFCFLSLPINGATSGSVKINLVSGSFSLNVLDTPVKVPPVPYPDTQ